MNDGEEGSVKMMGMMGKTMPVPIMSMRRVTNRIGNIFLFIELEESERFRTSRNDIDFYASGSGGRNSSPPLSVFWGYSWG